MESQARFGFCRFTAVTTIIQIPAVIGAQLPEKLTPGSSSFSHLRRAQRDYKLRGIIKISLLEARGVNASWSSFRVPPAITGSFPGESGVHLIVLAGFILLIIPGIIWSIKYQYMIYLVIDKNMGIRESMKLSAAMTDGVKWDLLAFEFITGIINVLGFSR